MTEDEAARIVAYLNAAFPHDSIEPETFAVFTRHIAGLQSAEVATIAAEMIATCGQRFPTLHEFMTTYRSRSEAMRARLPALEEPPPGPRELPPEVKEYIERLNTKQGLPSTPTLPAAPDGKCDDCGCNGERVLYGQLERKLCRGCAFSRMRVATTA